jgi:DtxR family Mn-dependent transcriptional regulator
LECFVTQFLGHDPAESFERAFMIGPSFDADAVERAYESLGRPERCPHGWPLDAAAARDESEGLMTLSAMAEGVAARVVRIDEDDREAAEGFFASGLRLGADVIIVTHEDSGEITLEQGKKPVTVSAEVAKTIFVRPN